jgi:hypothetical protein
MNRTFEYKNIFQILVLYLRNQVIRLAVVLVWLLSLSDKRSVTTGQLVRTRDVVVGQCRAHHPQRSQVGGH